MLSINKTHWIETPKWDKDKMIVKDNMQIISKTTEMAMLRKNRFQESITRVTKGHFIRYKGQVFRKT